MGTSSVNRSPQTARWRVVNNLYGDPDVSRERLLAEVFNAAAEQYPAGLSDTAVLSRLNALLETVHHSAGPLDLESALDTARNAVNSARREALFAGSASFYGDLADRALHTTIVSAEKNPETLSR